MLIVKNINKRYGEKVVFSNFNCQFPLGKISAILGNSGQGKTTLLNIVASLTDYEGEVSHKFENVSYVFQSPRLIPHLTIFQNVEYPLLDKINSKEERKEIVEKWLSLAEILHLKDKYPNYISGGEKQRVQLARAFAYPSNLLIMDEPFSSLDIGLKSRLIDLYAGFLQKESKTVLFVTHDVFEALTFADNIYVLGENKIESIDFDKNNSESIVKAEKEIYKRLKK